MNSEKVNAVDATSADIMRNDPVQEPMSLHGHYDVTCVGEDGQIKWTETIENLVVTVGKNDLLDKYFTGSVYTATWYMGLVDSTSFTAYAAGDTLASHTGWLEFLNYTVSGVNRATPSWSAASSGSKATTATSFPITGAGGSVLGAIMCTTLARNTASNGGAGILYSAGSFTGGARTVVSGDTLNVTYTAVVA